MIMVTMMMVTMMMVTMMMVTMMMVIPCWAVWVIYWGRGRLGCLAGRDWRRFGDGRTTKYCLVRTTAGPPRISSENTFSF